MQIFKTLCVKTLCGLALLAAAHSSLAASSSVLDAEISALKQEFTGTPKDVSSAAHKLEWTGITDPELFDGIAKRLEAGYTENTEFATELNSWLVKALAKSGDTKYQPLMNTIAARKDIKKLNKHTNTALTNLPKFQRWNPIISANNHTAKTKQELDRLRASNMLNSNEGELMETGTKIIARQYANDKDLVAAIHTRLLDNYQSADPTKLDALEWMCRALGESGNSEYKATLDKIADDSQTNKGVRKYAAKYSAILSKGQ